MEREIPGSIRYPLRSKLIENLKVKGTEQALLDIGQEGNSHPKILMEHAEALISALEKSNLLTYNSGHKKDHKKSDKKPKDIDGVKRDIERDGDLQLLVCIILFKINNPSVPENKQEELLIELMQQARQEGIGRIRDPRRINDRVWEDGVWNLEQKEKEIFQNLETDGESVDINSFRYEHEWKYNKALVEDFNKQIRSTTIVFQKFDILQKVVYLGFSLGIRDMKKAYSQENF